MPLEDSTAEETPLGKSADDYDADPESPSWEDLIERAQESIPLEIFSTIHSNPANAPPIRPCNTAKVCKNRVTFDNLKFH